MSKFQADPTTIRALLVRESHGFYVPLYQRNYRWGTEEIERLLEDLESGLMRIGGQGASSTFLGTVIVVEDRYLVSPRHEQALPDAVSNLIDGQQRIATLLLMCAVLARKLGKLNAELTQANPEPEGRTAWLLRLLADTTDLLRRAIRMDEMAGVEGDYKWRPRLIRQSGDAWGDDASSAQYSSDVAWYLMENIRAWRTGGDVATVSAATYPVLARVVQGLDDGVDRIGDGDTVCESLRDLSLYNRDEMIKKIVGSSVPHDPIELSDKSLAQPVVCSVSFG